MKILEQKKNVNTGVCYRLYYVDGGRFIGYGSQYNQGNLGDWRASEGNFGFQYFMDAKERFDYLVNREF